MVDSCFTFKRKKPLVFLFFSFFPSPRLFVDQLPLLDTFVADDANMCIMMSFPMPWPMLRYEFFQEIYIHIYFITRPTSLFLHTFAHIRMFPSICTRNFLFRLDRVLHQLHNCSPDSENPSQKNIQHEKLSPIFHEH